MHIYSILVINSIPFPRIGPLGINITVVLSIAFIFIAQLCQHNLHEGCPTHATIYNIISLYTYLFIICANSTFMRCSPYKQLYICIIYEYAVIHLWSLGPFLITICHMLSATSIAWYLQHFEHATTVQCILGVSLESEIYQNVSLLVINNFNVTLIFHSRAQFHSSLYYHFVYIVNHLNPHAFYFCFYIFFHFLLSVSQCLLLVG